QLDGVAGGDERAVVRVARQLQRRTSACRFREAPDQIEIERGRLSVTHPLLRGLYVTGAQLGERQNLVPARTPAALDQRKRRTAGVVEDLALRPQWFARLEQRRTQAAVRKPS